MVIDPMFERFPRTARTGFLRFSIEILPDMFRLNSGRESQLLTTQLREWPSHPIATGRVGNLLDRNLIMFDHDQVGAADL